MNIGFAFYLEKTKRVDEVFEALSKAGIRTIENETGQRLHLSLINGSDGDIEGFIKKVDSLKVETFSLDISYLNEFKAAHRVCYLALSKKSEEQLRSLHKEILGFTKDSGVQVYDYYKQETWVPHVSLAGGYQDRLEEKVAKIAAVFKPFALTVTGYGIARFTAEEVTIIKEWPLKLRKLGAIAKG